MYEIFFKLIKEKGITPYKVAKDTGISNTTLSAWKNDKISISPKKLSVLADYLGVTVDYLMGRTDNPSVATLDTKMREIIEKHLPDYAPSKIQSVYDELSEENQNALLKFAEYLLFEQNKNRP